MARIDNMEENYFVITRVEKQRLSDGDGRSLDRDSQVRLSLEGQAPASLIKSVHSLSDILRRSDNLFVEAWAKRLCRAKALPLSRDEVMRLEFQTSHCRGNSTSQRPSVRNSSRVMTGQSHSRHYCR